MQAIMTKYLGPTDYRGSRIKAYTESGQTLTIDYPHERNMGADAHSVAALALVKRLGWRGDLIAGATDTGYVFVFADSERYPSPVTDEDYDRAQDLTRRRIDAIMAGQTPPRA